MDAAKLECEHPSTVLRPACLFPWILGVFDTMAIVGNGCGKIRGGGNSLSLPSASNMLEREGGDLWLVIISDIQQTVYFTSTTSFVI